MSPRSLLLPTSRFSAPASSKTIQAGSRPWPTGSPRRPFRRTPFRKNRSRKNRSSFASKTPASTARPSATSFCYELHRQGFDLALLDPHAVWKAFNDDRKTDALDSRRIAEYGFRYRDRLEPWSPQETVAEQIKTLLTTREQLVEQKTAAQNARQSLRRKAVQTPPANEALDRVAEHLATQIEAIEQAIRDLIDQHPKMAQMVEIVASAPGARLLMGAHMWERTCWC